jgi:hypothetical protein
MSTVAAMIWPEKNQQLSHSQRKQNCRSVRQPDIEQHSSFSGETSKAEICGLKEEQLLALTGRMVHGVAHDIRELMATHDKGIPDDIAAKATCVAVVPGFKKEPSSSVVNRVRASSLAARAMAGVLRPLSNSLEPTSACRSADRQLISSSLALRGTLSSASFTTS